MDAPDLGTPYLHATVERRVLHVRIDRAERRNAMTLDMYRGLRDAAILADGDAEIDAVCVRGTGDWFSAGGDMSGNQEDSAALAELDPSLNFPFKHFESKAIAVGSIGQVHRARLRNGRAVVVKVLRPGIEKAIRRDVDAAVGQPGGSAIERA